MNSESRSDAIAIEANGKDLAVVLRPADNRIVALREQIADAKVALRGLSPLMTATYSDEFEPACVRWRTARRQVWCCMARIAREDLWAVCIPAWLQWLSAFDEAAILVMDFEREVSETPRIGEPTATLFAPLGIPAATWRFLGLLDAWRNQIPTRFCVRQDVCCYLQEQIGACLAEVERELKTGSQKDPLGPV